MKGIIFDLDGTLLYTLEDIADAMNTALAELSLPAIEVEQYRWIVGGGAENIAARVLPDSMHSDEQIRAFVDRFRTHYRLNWHAKTRPYDGINELIDFLIAADLRIGILSNKPQEFTLNIVRHYFHQDREIFVPVFGQQSGVPVKPDAGMALNIAELWGLHPSEIGFMGDSDVDIHTAKHAGMISIGAEWGFRGREELAAMQCDLMLAHPAELIPLLA